MFANNQNEVMNYNVILNKKNYNDRLSRLKVSLTSMNLKEFIDNDVIEQLKKKNPNDKARIKKTMMKDSKVQMVIFNTINIETHNSIRNLKTTYDILRKLKEKYKEDLNESMEKWIILSNFFNILVIINKKLLKFGKSGNQTLKVQPDGHVMNFVTILNEIEEIYSNMEENNLKLSKEEKMKFVYNAMPSCTQMKIVIDNDTNKNRIKIGYKTNNPMDTDSINRMYKGINNQKCFICNSTKHLKKDCKYNIFNKKSKYYKFLDEEDRKLNRKYRHNRYIENMEFEEDINYEDIQCKILAISFLVWVKLFNISLSSCPIRLILTYVVDLVP
ncbi:hypothetical protein H8356DRAFT_1428435 [Neocallimastix lanati (nom. inval.)]|nr:hypothetical protein H8356DRAFT_1428435 [Neocallimastix sp. JGI-2020a]